MQIDDLISSYAGIRENEIRGIFASFSILQNRLQTLFDKADSEMTSKQFMLIVMIKISNGDTTFTSLGKLLGSSRQNIKKLATTLEKKGFVTINPDPKNNRKVRIETTATADSYFQKVYALHTLKLNDIFKDYSDDEIHLFYTLITKLYAGVEREEKR